MPLETLVVVGGGQNMNVGRSLGEDDSNPQGDLEGSGLQRVQDAVGAAGGPGGEVGPEGGTARLPLTVTLPATGMRPAGGESDTLARSCYPGPGRECGFQRWPLSLEMP